MFLKANPPNMLPTQTLTNSTIGGDGTRGAAQENVARIGWMALLTVAGAVAGVALLL